MNIPRYLICLVLLGGCASAPKVSRLIIPEADAKAYVSPEGEAWVLLRADRRPNGNYSLAFVPAGTPSNAWKEMISFATRSPAFSQEEIRKKFEGARNFAGPGMSFDITGSVDTFVVRYRLPSLNESGIQKVFSVNGVSASVYYQERLGEVGSAKLKTWDQAISNMPNQALEPMARSVTPRAGAQVAPAHAMAHH